jgi:hypothetical protein
MRWRQNLKTCHILHLHMMHRCMCRITRIVLVISSGAKVHVDVWTKQKYFPYTNIDILN